MRVKMTLKPGIEMTPEIEEYLEECEEIMNKHINTPEYEKALVDKVFDDMWNQHIGVQENRL